MPTPSNDRQNPAMGSWLTAGRESGAETVGGGLLYPYRYAWKNNSKRVTLYGRPCRIVARGAMNSIMIAFEDGQTEIVSRNAVRLRSPKR
jgi:hypothetical protein